MTNAIDPNQLLSILIKTINDLSSGITRTFSNEEVTRYYFATVDTYFTDKESESLAAYSICSSLYEQLLKRQSFERIGPNSEALLREMTNISFMTQMARKKSLGYEFNDHSRYKHLCGLFAASKKEGSYAHGFYQKFINEVASFDIRLYNFAWQITLQTQELFKPEVKELDTFSQTLLKDSVDFTAYIKPDDTRTLTIREDSAGNKATTFISHALISSGISPNGQLPDGAFYFLTELVLKKGDKEAAKQHLAMAGNFYQGVTSIYDKAKVTLAPIDSVDPQR